MAPGFHLPTPGRNPDPQGSGASACSASTTFHIQEERFGKWVDYAQKDSVEIVIARLAELKIEKPWRVFRGIVRLTSDHLLPNSDSTTDGSYNAINESKDLK